MRSEERRDGPVVSRCRSAAAVAVVAALGWGWPGLAATGADAGLTAEQQLDFASLSTEAGVDPQLWLDEANGTPRLLSLGVPATAKGVRHAEDRSSPRILTGRQFLSEHRRLFKLSDPDTELSLVKAETDEVSLSHLRFQQRHRGVPVWAAEVLVHLDAEGRVYQVQGHFLPTPDELDVAPEIPPDAAVAAARRHLGVGDAPLRNAASAELVLFGQDGGVPRLVYEVRLSPRPDSSWTYFVDARTGAVLERRTNLREERVFPATGLGSQDTLQSFGAWFDGSQYVLLDPEIPLADVPGYDPLAGFDPSLLHGDLVVLDAQNAEEPGGVLITSPSASGPWSDVAPGATGSAGVSAMANLSLVNAYYQRTFQRAGVDGQGKTILAAVHYGTEYNNAFWNGEWLLFRDAEGPTFAPFAGCLDIVAHEYAHGVTEYTTNLVYAGQSGALNESYSDLFAALVDGNWTAGEDCVLERPGFLRDLANPHRSMGWQPATMEEYVHLPRAEEYDNGGVHTNSGIPNRAGYLLTKAVGPEKAAQILFKSLTDYLTPTATFWDARNAWRDAARELYGAQEASAVVAAWNSVELKDITPLGKAWGGQGSGGGGGGSVGGCFVSACAPAGSAAPLPAVLALAVLAAALGRRSNGAAER